MKRTVTLSMLGVLVFAMGATTDGCDPSLLLSLRPDPVIIANSPKDSTRVRALEVDLRDYPDAQSISWEFGDGATQKNLAVSKGRNISHEFSGDGVFTVTVHLFSGADFINNKPAQHLASGRLPVEVLGANSIPTAAFIVQDITDATETGTALKKRFIATSSTDRDGRIVSFDWDFGDGEEDFGKTIDHEFIRSGRYPVKLTVTDNRGDKNSVTHLVLVNSLPAASFTATVDPTNALRYTFNGSGSTDPDGSIVQYTWDFGDDSDTVTGQTVSHTYAEPNDYTVKLTVTDSLGASISTTQDVDVTGTEPFVRSASPPDGELDTAVSEVTIDGENFVDGATVHLERGATVINATSVTFQDAKTLKASFDLSGAVTGDYTLVVENPDNSTASKIEGFRVVTPNLVRLTTSKGDVVIELLRDGAPITTENFIKYVESGFYDGTIFHRVIPNFVVQGGGFLPGMVEQTPKLPPIVNEFSPDRSNLRGTLAMAKLPDNPDSATSEFFFNLTDNSSNLDGQNGGFTVFARVVEGMDVVDAIAAVPRSGEQPIDDVLLITARRE